MFNVNKNGIKVYVGKVPGQKKSSLYISEGGTEYRVAAFYSEALADLFVNKFAEFLGVPVNPDDDED